MSTLLTKKGLEIVKAELENVRTVQLPRAEREYKVVLDYGYTADDQLRKDAKDKRDFYRQRIKVLEDMIANAKMSNADNEQTKLEEWKMNRQAVCDVLNSFEVIERDLGDMPYILVANSDENREKLNAVGVQNDRIDAVGDKDTFCILALAFFDNNPLADDFANDKFIVWEKLVDDELRQRVLNGEQRETDAYRLLKALEPNLFNA